MECHGLQCGFCTPGMMMTGRALLDEQPATRPRRRSATAISGNICRCTGYKNIVARDPVGRRARRRQRRDQEADRMTAVENAPRAPPAERPSASAACTRKEDARFMRGEGNYVDDISLPGMLLRRDPAQPVRPRADRLDRHLGGRGASRTSTAVITGEDARDPRPRVDADAVLRHPGRARHRQGALPGPGGRVRGRRRRATSPSDALELIDVEYEPLPAVVDAQQGARRRRADHPRRQGGPDRQPHLRLGGRRPGRHRRGVRRGRRRRRPRTSSTRAAPGADGDLRDRSPTSTRSTGKLDLYDDNQAPHAHRTVYALVAGLARAQDPGDQRRTSAAASATRCRSTPATSARSSARSSPASR